MFLRFILLFDFVSKTRFERRISRRGGYLFIVMDCIVVVDVFFIGVFVRKVLMFRNVFDVNGVYLFEVYCYVLVVSLVCSWVTRCLVVLRVKGFEDVFDVVVMYFVWGKI